MEEISTGVYLDGAHNADGIRAFLDAACRLKELRKPDHVRILFAVSADKDHQRMLREIAERLKPDLWILSKMESHRTLSVEDLEAAAEKLRAEYGEETEYRVSRDVAKLADVLGHSSIETTRIYLLTSGAEHQRQLDRLGLVL